MAAWPRLGRRFRSGAAAFAAATSSAVLTQFWGGYIEGHFHYFVIVAVIALYQDWVPFLLAIAYVAIDHGLIGSLAPTWVYNHPDAIAHPWKWAVIHAVLVLAECVALLVLWKSAERAQRVAVESQVEVDRLRGRDEFKTRLLTTMSHELKTPLTPLRIQLDTLERGRIGPLNDRQQRSVVILTRNLQRLSTLVDQTLEVGRLEAGRLRLSVGPTDMAPIVREVVETFQDAAADKGLRVEVLADGPVPVQADADRMTQVVYNLMNNAVKFTPSGGTITVEAVGEHDRATVRVRDDGEGIRPEDIHTLFQPFSQVHDTMEKTDAGSGLGLYISRGIVELPGGRIWCESPGPGRGSSFTFWIPRQAPVQAA